MQCTLRDMHDMYTICAVGLVGRAYKPACMHRDMHDMCMIRVVLDVFDAMYVRETYACIG